jgi:hypothetical protein
MELGSEHDSDLSHSGLRNVEGGWRLGVEVWRLTNASVEVAEQAAS